MRTARTRFGVALVLFAATAIVRAGGADATGDAQVVQQRLVLSTVAGDIVIAFLADRGRESAEHVSELARRGVYDGVCFDRVVDGLTLEMGSLRDREMPLTAEQRATLSFVVPDDPGDARLPRGFVVLRPDRSGDDTGAFSIVLADQPSRGRVAFGRIERGFDVIDSLTRVSRDPHGRPRVRLSIESARIVDSADASVISQLRPAVPVYDPYAADGTTRTFHRILSAFLAVIALLGVGSVLLSDRLELRHQRSINLIQVSIAVLLIVMLQLPLADDMPLLGAALFVVLVGLFKLMSRFEA